ncbi:MAG: hypothetical protein IT161_20630 [Bryobacterales bacterium]|nr:hypothetical protein [Bryobacterales bacterium]
MNFFRLLMKYFSCLFHFVLGLFVAGLAAFFLITGANNVKMQMVPFWTGDALKYWLLGLGLLAVFSAVLAVMNKVRVLLVLWSLAALCIIVYGYFLSSYRFSGSAEAKSAGCLALGALAAFIGSLMQYPVRRA